MNLQELKVAVERLVDDVVNITDVTQWLNAGQNDMADAANAKFPQLNGSDLNSTFVFDEKYHELPILYASARYKQMDSAIAEYNSLMAEYVDKKKSFVAKWEVPMRYKDDPYTQQFVAAVDQDTFIITKQSYDPKYSDLKIYVNDIYKPDTEINSDFSFKLTNKCAENDAVTAIWEEHTDYQSPPYEWWDKW